jgi:adenine-specific DNA methylase
MNTISESYFFEPRSSRRWSQKPDFCLPHLQYTNIHGEMRYKPFGLRNRHNLSHFIQIDQRLIKSLESISTSEAPLQQKMPQGQDDRFQVHEKDIISLAKYNLIIDELAYEHIRIQPKLDLNLAGARRNSTKVR